MQSGVTFIELLIVWVLASFISLSAIQCYLLANKQFQWQQALADVQDDGRLASFYLSSAVHQAGFFACLPYTKAAETLSLPHQAITVYHGTTQGWEPVLPNWLAGHVAPGSDVLLVQTLGSELLNVAFPQKETSSLVATREFVVNENKPLVLVDCKHAQTFIALKNSLQKKQQHITVNTSVAPYDKGARVGLLHTRAYYIGARGNTLYELDKTFGQQEPLVEGVFAFKIHSNRAERQVIAFELITNSQQEVMTQSMRYLLQGHWIYAGDRRLYSRWTFQAKPWSYV